MSRIILLVLLSLGVASAFASDAAREAARSRPRRIIFNDDGGETRVPERPLPQPKDFLPERIAPLTGTQVDTIVFDTTSGTFNRFAHRTQVAEMFLVREGRYEHNILPDLLKLNTDPLQVVVDHCRQTGQEVFWTMRMNDTHDASNPLLVPKLKIDHPDWLMGTKAEPPKRGAWSSVDYGRPEIRDLARRLIAETAANYDLDGITLDFMRHPIFFRKTAAEQAVGDEERALMTGFLRDVRADLDAAGRRRGRPFLLSIKVPDSVGYCRDIGLDLERWLSEGLVDILVPGGYFQMNFWSVSVALARRHGVKIQASIAEPRIRGKTAMAQRASIECLRARAQAAWASGVDAIEMFNHFDPKSPLWRELGDPALLRTLPKVYFVSVQGSGQGRSFYPAQGHLVLPTLTPDAPDTLAAGTSKTYELFIGDDLRVVPALAARMVLRVGPAGGELPRVSWDGAALNLTAGEANTLSARVASAAVTPGLHRITIATRGELRLDDLLLRIERQ